jgi:hypothetical protein
MLPNITRYLNRTIFVSIPTLFEDGTCRAYKLLGAELNGLWLQSDELTQRLLTNDKQHFASLAPAVFVPFSHIAGVLVTTVPPRHPSRAPTEGVQAGADVGTEGKEADSENADDGQPKRKVKKGKGTRG